LCSPLTIIKIYSITKNPIKPEDKSLKLILINKYEMMNFLRL